MLSDISWYDVLMESRMDAELNIMGITDFGLKVLYESFSN